MGSLFKILHMNQPKIDNNEILESNKNNHKINRNIFRGIVSIEDYHKLQSLFKSLDCNLSFRESDDKIYYLISPKNNSIFLSHELKIFNHLKLIPKDNCCEIKIYDELLSIISDLEKYIGFKK